MTDAHLPSKQREEVRFLYWVLEQTGFFQDGPMRRMNLAISHPVLLPGECEGSTAVFGTARRGSFPRPGTSYGHNKFCVVNYAVGPVA